MLRDTEQATVCVLSGLSLAQYSNRLAQLYLAQLMSPETQLHGCSP